MDLSPGLMKGVARLTLAVRQVKVTIEYGSDVGHKPQGVEERQEVQQGDIGRIREPRPDRNYII